MKKNKIKKNLESYKSKAEEYLAGWKRSKADFLNFKRRTEEERQEFAKFANLDLILQILPVLDNFNEAVKHIPAKEEDSAWVQGIFYIQKQLANTLQEQGLEEIKIEKGDKFNPELMEAIESTKKDQSEDKVKKLVSKGYKLNGKVIRPGKVVV